jgi:hydroxymethylpyrimidine pyrophosphatase-like HAD family hydrolase
MAIGDDFTDIEMLQYAGIGVADGECIRGVKAFADCVTTSIEQDGVARGNRKWILVPLEAQRSYSKSHARSSRIAA